MSAQFSRSPQCVDPSICPVIVYALVISTSENEVIKYRTEA